MLTTELAAAPLPRKAVKSTSLNAMNLVLSYKNASGFPPKLSINKWKGKWTAASSSSSPFTEVSPLRKLWVQPSSQGGQRSDYFSGRSPDVNSDEQCCSSDSANNNEETEYTDNRQSPDEISFRLPELREVLTMIKERTNGTPNTDGKAPGNVFLVGTGPGDPELMTGESIECKFLFASEHHSF